MKPVWAWAILAWFLAAPGAEAQTRGPQPLRIACVESVTAFAPVVERVLQGAGVQYSLVYVPASRMGPLLQARAVDAAFFVSEALIRDLPEYVLVPVVLYRNDYVAVATDPLVKIRRMEDLVPYRVGFTRGQVSLEKAFGGLANVTRFVDEGQGFRMLGAHRFDVLIASLGSLRVFGPGSEVPLYPQEPPLIQVPLYFAIGRGLEGDRDRLDRGFRAAVADGSWARGVEEVFRALAGRP